MASRSRPLLGRAAMSISATAAVLVVFAMVVIAFVCAGLYVFGLR